MADAPLMVLSICACFSYQFDCRRNFSVDERSVWLESDLGSRFAISLCLDKSSVFILEVVFLWTYYEEEKKLYLKIRAVS